MNETSIATSRRARWRAGDMFLVNPKTILAVVAVSLTWVFSLTCLQRYAPAGLPTSVQAWARECPHCGTVESVARLVVPQAPGGIASSVYRLTIRMADGSIQRLEQAAPLAPGSQVLVQGGTIRPAPAPAQRQ